jgi:hypothetical protein
MRLMGWKATDWQNGTHFFAVASKMMRRVAVPVSLTQRKRPRRWGSRCAPYSVNGIWRAAQR